MFWVVRRRDGKLYGNGQNHINLYTDESFAKGKATKIKGKVEQVSVPVRIQENISQPNSDFWLKQIRPGPCPRCGSCYAQFYQDCELNLIPG